MRRPPAIQVFPCKRTLPTRVAEYACMHAHHVLEFHLPAALEECPSLHEGCTTGCVVHASVTIRREKKKKARREFDRLYQGGGGAYLSWPILLLVRPPGPIHRGTRSTTLAGLPCQLPVLNFHFLGVFGYLRWKPALATLVCGCSSCRQ